MCAQRRLKSTCASAQSDQTLQCPHEETESLAIENVPSVDSDQYTIAQVDLNLRCAHMYEVTFSDVEAHYSQ